MASTKVDGLLQPIDMASRHDIEDVFNAIRPHFEDKESEQNWQHRERDVTKLRRLALGNSSTTPALKDTYVAGIKSLLDGILKAVNSLRTTLSTNGCDLIQDLVRTMKVPAMDNLMEIILPHLIKLCANTKKLTANKADVTITVIMANVSYNISLMKLIASTCDDKNVQPRKFATGWLKTLVGRFRESKGIFEKGEGLSLFEKCLKKGLSDGNPDVRKGMRPTYWAFERLWPERSEGVISTLSEQHRKALMTESGETSQLGGPAKAAAPALTNAAAPKPKPSIKDAIAAKRQAAKEEKATAAPPAPTTRTLSSAPVRPSRAVSKASTETSTALLPAKKPEVPKAHRRPSVEKKPEVPKTHRRPSVEKKVEVPNAHRRPSVEKKVEVPKAHRRPSVEKKPEVPKSPRRLSDPKKVEVPRVPRRLSDPKKVEVPMVLRRWSDPKKPAVSRSPRRLSPRWERKVEKFFSAVHGIQSRTIGLSGFHTLQSLIRDSDVMGQGCEMFDELVLALLDFVEAATSDASEDLKFQAVSTIQLLLEIKPEHFRPFLPRVLCVLVGSVKHFHHRSHMRIGIEETCMDIIHSCDIDVGEDCIDILIDLLQSQDLREVDTLSVGLVVLASILDGRSRSCTMHSLRQAERLAQLTLRCLASHDVTVRKVVTYFAVRLFAYVEGHSQFWDLVAPMEVEVANLFAYFAVRQSPTETKDVTDATKMAS